MTKASEGHAQTTYPDILLCREDVRLTPIKLDKPKFDWHYTNIGAIYEKDLKMSTPSRSQSSTMCGEDYFVWGERMERHQQKNDRQMQTCSTKRNDSENRMKSYGLKCRQRVSLKVVTLRVDKQPWDELLKHLTSGAQSSHLAVIQDNPGRNLCRIAKCSRMKAPTLFGYQGKWGTIEGRIYLMQCELDWDLKH